MWDKSRLGAALLVAALALVVLFFCLRPRTPAVTRTDYERAEQLWSAQRPVDYTVKVLKEADVLGTERFATTVRGGKATEFLMNGAPLAAKPTYTVDGLFETIGREIDMLEDVHGAKKEGQPDGAVLKARFHEELGLPLVFKRFATDGKSFVLSIEEFRVPDRGVLYP